MSYVLTPEGREAKRKYMRERWQDPVYREKIASMLRGQASWAVEARDSKRALLPKRKTPEWRHYEKLRRALGLAAAREALGIRL